MRNRLRHSARPPRPQPRRTRIAAGAPGIDISTEAAGRVLPSALPAHVIFDVVIVCAGYFAREAFEEVVRMTTMCAVGPVFVVQALVRAGKVCTGIGADGGGKIMVSSESGSIVQRHASEGGGNYAHHANKSALNMVRKLLNLDLRDREITVAIVHVGLFFHYYNCFLAARVHGHRNDHECRVRPVLGLGRSHPLIQRS
ncbi:hypothetical protein C8J57DRAFT_218701 [Mycena rebaudengoi]|nr:hypothetical protein C8J57DRAFT_218701 [Mycena rebaudengoi]